MIYPAKNAFAFSGVSFLQLELTATNATLRVILIFFSRAFGIPEIPVGKGGHQVAQNNHRYLAGEIG